MKIGIDISPLQTGHRMRGVGYTIINFINNLPAKEKSNNSFTFFYYKDASNPLKLLNLDNINYDSQYIRRPSTSSLHFSGKLNLINRVINNLYRQRDLVFGDPRIQGIKNIEYFLQFDQNQILPARHKVKSVLILYDLIPLVMESDYLYSYDTARRRGHSRKGSILHHMSRRNYARKLRRNAKRAEKLIAISEHTKNDCTKYLDINGRKIQVCHLGVNPLQTNNHYEKVAFEKYERTDWGYMRRPVNIKPKNYILYVGGADPRRKLTDLVASYNILRAQGQNIKLVLAGDTMLGAFKVPNVELQEYLKNTSYLDDIYFVGFVGDEQRDWLYKNAIAFIYPSVYEGFGLPILEAMQHGTPVVTYANSSINEISGSAAIYATNYLDIANQVYRLIGDSKLLEKYVMLGKKQAAKFSWKESCKQIFTVINTG